METYKFYKTKEDRWFIDLPSWDGEMDDLEMVSGADTMLDILSEYGTECNITISENKFDNHNFTLEFTREYFGGGMYIYKSQFGEFEVWLCYVTKFIFNGELPKLLYCR